MSAGAKPAGALHEPERSIRVLVVAATAAQRATLITLIERDHVLDVIGSSAPGAEAVQAVARLRPDVVALKVGEHGVQGSHGGRTTLPEGTRGSPQHGVQPEAAHPEDTDLAFVTMQHIMQEAPTPLVAITAGSGPAGADVVAAAMRAGALAVVTQPPAGQRDSTTALELRRALKRMAHVQVIRRHSSRTDKRGPGSGEREPAPTHSSPAPTRREGVATPGVIAMGASTGGPQALAEILTRLPASFAPPIVIVQHIASGFDRTLIEWLAPQCALPMRLITQSLPLDRPGIYVAPSGHHVEVRMQSQPLHAAEAATGHVEAPHSGPAGGPPHPQDSRGLQGDHKRQGLHKSSLGSERGASPVLVMSDGPPVAGHRPSATVLFRSIARTFGVRAVGVLLTGMGDDGAAGMQELKRAGATTIAQDGESSVVFGMPARAIDLGVVDYVLPLSHIAPRLLALVEHGRVGR